MSLLVVVIFVLAPGVARGGGALIWQDVVDFGSQDRGYAIAAGGGRVFVAGRAQSPDSPPDWFVRAYDGSTGAIVWTDRFDAAASWDAAVAVAVDGGRVFVAGESALGGPEDSVVRAYDAATGALLWEDRYDLAGGPEFPNSIAAGGGRVVVVGGGINIYGNEDAIVRAYDAGSGAVLWSYAGGGPGGGGSGGGDDEATAVVIERDRVYVTGILARNGSCAINNFTPSYSGNCDFAVGAFDAATGAVLWEDDLDLGRDFDAAYSIAVSGDRVVAAGTVTPLGSTCEAGTDGAGGNCDYFVRAYDAGTGQVVWTDQYDRADQGFDRANSVAAEAGRVFASGFAAQPGGGCTSPFVIGGNCDFTVRAYDARTGVVIWTTEFDLAGGFDAAGQIAVQGGEVIAAGRGQMNNRLANAYSRYQDALVRAYDARTGAFVWGAQFDLAGGHDRVSGLAVQGNRVFIAGRARNASNNDDLFVRAYER